MYDYGYATESVASATMGNAGLAGLFIGMMIFSSIIALISIISYAKLFKKAGKPWWASIIPIYNTIVMIEIAKLPIWYIVLFIVPIANIYAIFKINIEMAKKFGKSTGFGIGMTLFSIIFIPLLAFSDNKYEDNDMVENNSNDVNSFDANSVINNNETTVPPIENTIPMVDNITVQNNNENTIPTVDNNTQVNEVQEQNSIPVIEQAPVNIEPVSIPVEPTIIPSEIPVVETQNIETTPEVNVEPVIQEKVEPVVNNMSQLNAFNMAPAVEAPQKIEEIKVEPIVQEEVKPNVSIETLENVSNNISLDNNIELDTNIAEDKKVCKNCGNELPEIVSICPNCGTDNE